MGVFDVLSSSVAVVLIRNGVEDLKDGIFNGETGQKALHVVVNVRNSKSAAVGAKHWSLMVRVSALICQFPATINLINFSSSSIL